MWIYLIIIISTILLTYVLLIYNKLIKLDNKVTEAFSTMDVYLKKRWDLIPNIIEVVKGYVKHEEGTLVEITKLRNHIYDDLNINEKLSTNRKISNNINNLMLLKENYPELKSDKIFQDLSSKLSKIEDEIAHSRKYYNATIRDFNNKVEMFPSNVIAKIFGYKSKNMFEISSKERKNIKVEL